ncbi:transposase domain-containing protein, partial [Acidovorax facilis]|uniref:transposase domain-containing protein n=1 Tax=Acidovorax facilis TaxID=12917 RepID=UPI00208F034D
AGERAAVVMSLLQSARLNGHEPWAYLKDVLTRLPTQLNSRIEVSGQPWHLETMAYS